MVTQRRVGSTKGAKKRADVAFSKIVRSRGVCEARMWEAAECAGPLQCAHIISRRFSNTRCVEDNAMALCAGHHHYFTDHPVEWGRFVLWMIGDDAYDALQELSLSTVKVDWEQVAGELKARLAEVAA